MSRDGTRSCDGPRPMASLNAGLLGRRAAARRVPLSFGPIEEAALVEAPVEAATGELPEVMQQVMRLAQALGVDMAPSAAEPQPVDDGEIVRRRVAFTLRLDSERHGQLRQIALAQGRSAQQVLVEALDRYRATTLLKPISSATPSSQCLLPTGNQP
jgi:hypothetical protein